MTTPVRPGTTATDLAVVTDRVAATEVAVQAAVELIEEAIAPSTPAPRTLALVDTVAGADRHGGVLLATDSTPPLSTMLTLPAGTDVPAGRVHQVAGGATGVQLAPGAGAVVEGGGLVPPGGLATTVKRTTSTWSVSGTGATHHTAAGTPYTQVQTRPTTGQDAIVLTPLSAYTTTQVPVVVACHGVGNDASMITGASDWLALREAILDAGWVLACSDAHAQAWGNDTSQADIVAMRTRISSILGPGPTLLIGQSMGGMPSLLLAADHELPDLRGWAGIAPVCSLANMYAAGTYAASIRAAYGIAADGSDYAALTADHDPLLRPATDYAGIPMRLYASPGDTIVTKAANADAFAGHVTAQVPEAQVVTVTGTHLSPEHYLPGDLLDFLERCLA